jgi:serine/threonine protein kinase
MDKDERRLVSALEGLKSSTAAAAPAISGVSDIAWIPDEILSGDSSVVKLTIDSKSNLIAVKTARNAERAKLIQREATILATVKHPLVLELRGHISNPPDSKESIVTGYAGHGALARHLPRECGDQCRLRGPTRIAKVIAGIAIAMRFVHSRDVIHRHLTPENILLDWDWTVRIADFGESTSPAAPEPHLLTHRGTCLDWVSVCSHYLAPECYHGTFLQASDVFAFGLILFEILSGRTAFSESLHPYQTAFKVSVEDNRPEIPASVLPHTRALIEDCWATDPDNRPTFKGIVDRLAEMAFKVTADVNSAKIAAFVKRIEEWESNHLSD